VPARWESGLSIDLEPALAILEGTKTWELRGESCAKRERIAIIPNETGMIYGDVVITEDITINSHRQFLRHSDKHQCRWEDLDYSLPCHAWVLADAIVYLPSDRIRVNKPEGARMFVTLGDPGVIVS
jgi:hypothetical protein